MKLIMCHISFLLASICATAQGPKADFRPEPITPPATVQLVQLAAPDYLPEAAEYAFSLQVDAQTSQVMVRVNAAPAPAHGRITDENGNLLFFAPAMEEDRSYLFPALPSGTYLLRLDTDEGLPAGCYRIVCP